ncbi:MAG: multicopper oxidase domain-containing protein [Anaerolineaceae bacterium]|nr:multicopper oxidase domain-containing protein [Anaerolineaceae bacterium]
MAEQLGRRRFLKMAGISAGSVGAAAAFSQPGKIFSAGNAPELSSGRTNVLQETAEEMDAMHEAGVKKFLENIGKDPNFFPAPMEPVMDGDVKVFNLTCQDVQWETSPGNTFPAMTYNGIVPGPILRFTEGDKVRIVVKNEMKQSTAIHFHGLRVPNDQDGVPFLTQPVIKPGETHQYEFVAPNSGTHMYHSHHNAAEQVTSGLLGALIVDPKDKSREPVVDGDYTIILNDSTLGFTLNGKEFPYTQPVVAQKGQKLRIRYMNEGLMIHPMHLHGIPQMVIAKDGFNLPVPYMCDTVNIAPGERYDVIIEADSVGVWAFHCHILTHAESRHGMYGMVTVLIVK